MTIENTPESIDNRLRRAGVPQSALDRLKPSLGGSLVWDSAKLMFVPEENPKIQHDTFTSITGSLPK